MSLDTHIRFMRDPNAMTRISSLFTNLQSKYSENKAHHFPYAILEIEVAAENTPLWLKVKYPGSVLLFLSQQHVCTPTLPTVLAYVCLVVASLIEMKSGC